MHESAARTEFRSLVVKLSERRQQSLNQLFDSADAWGDVSTSWVKDRYYGRIKVKSADCDRLHSVLEPNGELPRVVSELAMFKGAVARMCGECVGAHSSCWDATCPLRPVSPVPLRKR